MNDDSSNNDAAHIHFTYPDYQHHVNHGHLIPAGPSGIHSLQQSPLSIPSFGSPSISISPTEDAIRHGLDIPLFYDHSTNYIDDTQPLFDNANPLPSTETDGTGFDPLYFAPAPAPQASNEIYQDEFKLAVEHLINMVRTDVLQRQIPQLHDAKDFLQVTWHRLDSMIQQQINISERLADTGPRTSNFRCQLCPSGQRKVYNTRASFRRHVAYEHAPRSIYRCLDDKCLWTTKRKDKLHSHLRHNHGFQWRATREQINIVETKMPPPRVCPLCQSAVDSWDEYFKCVCEHSRVAGAGSASTSASQSRRNSDDRGQGSGGSNYNNFQFPGSEFGANNGQSSSGNGNHTGSTFFSTGYRQSQHTHQATHNVSDLAPATLTGLNPGVVSGDGPLYLPDVDGPRSEEKTSPGPTSLTSQHWSMMNATNPTTCGPHNKGTVSEIHKSPISTSGSEEHKRRPCSEESLQKKFHARGQGELHHEQNEERPEKKCTTCGHVFDNCSRCRRSKALSEKCHQCVDRTGNRAGLQKAYIWRSRDQAPDVNRQDALAHSVTDTTRSLPLKNIRIRSSDLLHAMGASKECRPSEVSSLKREPTIYPARSRTRLDGGSHEPCTTQPLSFLKSILSIDTDVVISTETLSRKDTAVALHAPGRYLPAKVQDQSTPEAMARLHQRRAGQRATPFMARNQRLVSFDDEKIDICDSNSWVPHEKTLTLNYLDHAVLHVMYSFLSEMILYEIKIEQGTLVESMGVNVTRRSLGWLCKPSKQKTGLPQLTKKRVAKKKSTTMLRARLHIVVELLALHAMAIKRRSQRKCWTDGTNPAKVVDRSISCTLTEMASPDDVVSPLFDAVVMWDTFAMVNIVSSWIATVVPDTEGQVELMLLMWSYIYIILNGSPITLRLQS
ncbi:hypothetical protein BO99DRAFT_4076 [Aspergillus violaceofuscus CBS 115571]|uniref:C2H2-type domain-containing protein n=1 Tax=Aspergillus violaceofuscus (strain CBS 115571) TaxID=1450538 RepID=A0A2V5HK33_ASPV1|nr:hypothetical protein BO99DRAFT_4076 [Aspergillus violaceofuscus CBS 115571]